MEKAVLQISRKLNSEISQGFLDTSSKKTGRTRKRSLIRFRGKTHFFSTYGMLAGLLQPKERVLSLSVLEAFSAQEVSMESIPADCVYVSIDNIGVKHQKESRAKGSERDYKFVENTVAHIQYGEKTYVLTGRGMRNVFKSVLAFLLMNNLLSRELVFMIDVAMDIKSYIESVFQFHSYTIILDWFHLKKDARSG